MGSSCNGSPLLGSESDDLDYVNPRPAYTSGLKSADIVLATSRSDSKWVESSAATSTRKILRSANKSSRDYDFKDAQTRLCGADAHVYGKGKVELMDENADANKVATKIALYADALIQLFWLKGRAME